MIPRGPLNSRTRDNQDIIKCHCDECASAEERVLKASHDSLIKQQIKYKTITSQLKDLLHPAEYSQDLRLHNSLVCIQKEIVERLSNTEQNLDRLQKILSNPSNFTTHQEAQNSRRLRAAIQPTQGRALPRSPQPAFQPGPPTRPPRRVSSWNEPRGPRY